MDFLRKMTGTTPSPDAGDKRIREEPPPNKLTKKPHQPNLKTDLGTILAALPVSTVLGKGSSLPSEDFINDRGSLTAYPEA